MTIRSFEKADEAQVVALWRLCGLVVPWNDPHADIARKMQVQPELFFVGEIEGCIAAACFAPPSRKSSGAVWGARLSNTPSKLCANLAARKSILNNWPLG